MNGSEVITSRGVSDNTNTMDAIWRNGRKYVVTSIGCDPYVQHQPNAKQSVTGSVVARYATSDPSACAENERPLVSYHALVSEQYLGTPTPEVTLNSFVANDEGSRENTDMNCNVKTVRFADQPEVLSSPKAAFDTDRHGSVATAAAQKCSSYSTAEKRQKAEVERGAGTIRKRRRSDSSSSSSSSDSSSSDDSSSSSSDSSSSDSSSDSDNDTKDPTSRTKTSESSRTESTQPSYQLFPAAVAPIKLSHKPFVVASSTANETMVQSKAVSAPIKLFLKSATAKAFETSKRQERSPSINSNASSEPLPPGVLATPLPVPPPPAGVSPSLPTQQASTSKQQSPPEEAAITKRIATEESKNSARSSSRYSEASLPSRRSDREHYVRSGEHSDRARSRSRSGKRSRRSRSRSPCRRSRSRSPRKGSYRDRSRRYESDSRSRRESSRSQRDSRRYAGSSRYDRREDSGSGSSRSRREPHSRLDKSRIVRTDPFDVLVPMPDERYTCSHIIRMQERYTETEIGASRRNFLEQNSGERTSIYSRY